MRGYVHKKNIITSMTRVDGNNAILETLNGIEFGVNGDMIATRLDGEQEIIPEGNLDDYIQISFNIGDMAQGYMDMGDINLGIAKEDLHMENEADATTSKLLSGKEVEGKNK